MRNANKKAVKAREDSKEKVQLLDIGPIPFGHSISVDSDEDKEHHPSGTSMNTKLERIKKGTSGSQRLQRQKIKDIQSFNDVRKWYFQNPVGHLPAVYFFISFLLSFLFTVYWFMDNDSSYVLCGVVGLVIFAYAARKFKISFDIKKEIDTYKRLNLEFMRQNIKMKANVDRASKASSMLKKTRRRLTIANNANKENLKEFEKIEYILKIAGQKAVKGMGNVHKKAINIREAWRAEYLSNERNMLNAVYNRFERKHSGKSKLGMSEKDFQEFHKMLPRRYGTRFMRMGTFTTLAGNDGSLMDYRQFANCLDVYAQMEVDNVDIDITPNVSPRHSRQKPELYLQGLDQNLRYDSL